MSLQLANSKGTFTALVITVKSRLFLISLAIWATVVPASRVIVSPWWMISGLFSNEVLEITSTGPKCEDYISLNLNDFVAYLPLLSL